MSKPIIAIIGRPNVGKSTLFNRMTGQRKAIVEEVEGVTRDRNYSEIEWGGRRFLIADTGGLLPGQKDIIFEEMGRQTMLAVEEADLIVHLLDAQAGLTARDEAIAGMLRESGKKVLWVANKIDGPSKEPLLYDFYRLGGEVLPVSASNGYMYEELMDRLVSMLPPPSPMENEILESLPRIAVIGRPNTGKSTLINSLLTRERLVVSPVAGTTRDAIDTVCTYYKKKYMFVDTAGITRKAGRALDQYSTARAMKALERADMALIVIDASAGIVAADQKIAGMVYDYKKGAVFLLNKWDLVEDPDAAFKKLGEELRRKLWFFGHAPVLTTSGTARKRITKVFPLIDCVLEERARTVPPAKLGDLLRDALAEKQPPVYHGKRVIASSLVQIGVRPPVFALVLNEPEGINEQYLKYFEKKLRERFPFSGTPVIVVKKKAGMKTVRR
ncbi:MAG: ribosome biogenesis GTPase Der [Actinomycetota bacterium]|nr:ribosome biogenesis GTPase Der [Actinomycetota bacterium]